MIGTKRRSAVPQSAVASEELSPTTSLLGPSPIRILLIDEHRLVRAGVRLLLETRPDFCVVGEAGERSEALAVAARQQPDVIVCGLWLGDHDALDLLPALRAAAGQARVLVLTGMPRPDLHRQAIRLGARGVVLKEHSIDTLLQAIEKVHAGEVWLDSSLLTALLDELAPHHKCALQDPEGAKIATLSAREREVIALVSEGLRNKQIAKRLFVSETTVRHHLTSIFTKLGVADRLDLLLYAYQHGLATLPS